MKYNIEYPFPFRGPLCFYYYVDNPIMISDFAATVNKKEIRVNDWIIPPKRGLIQRLSIDPIIDGGFRVFVYIDTKYPNWEIDGYDPSSGRFYKLRTHYEANWEGLKIPESRVIIPDPGPKRKIRYI